MSINRIRESSTILMRTVRVVSRWLTRRAQRRNRLLAERNDKLGREIASRNKVVTGQNKVIADLQSERVELLAKAAQLEETEEELKTAYGDKLDLKDYNKDLIDEVDALKVQITELQEKTRSDYRDFAEERAQFGQQLEALDLKLGEAKLYASQKEKLADQLQRRLDLAEMDIETLTLWRERELARMRAEADIAAITSKRAGIAANDNRQASSPEA